jgi:hypothetical protein
MLKLNGSRLVINLSVNKMRFCDDIKR